MGFLEKILGEQEFRAGGFRKARQGVAVEFMHSGSKRRGMIVGVRRREKKFIIVMKGKKRPMTVVKERMEVRMLSSRAKIV